METNDKQKANIAASLTIPLHPDLVENLAFITPPTECHLSHSVKCSLRAPPRRELVRRMNAAQQIRLTVICYL